MSDEAANMREIEVLSTITRLVASGKEGSTRFEEVFELLAKLVPYECASIFIWDEDKENLDGVADYKGGIDLAGQFSFGSGMGLSSYVAEQKRVLLLNDMHNGPRFGEGSLRSFASVPMLVEGRLVGVLNLGHYEAKVFKDSHIELLEIVASQLASIFLELDYTAKLKEKNRELETTNRQLKEAQDKLVEAEKMATLGHLTAGINHEINNPLAIISGHLQLLEMESDNLSSDVVDRIGIILGEVDRISEVLQNLQKVKKIHLSKYTESGVKMINIEESIQ